MSRQPQSPTLTRRHALALVAGGGGLALAGATGADLAVGGSLRRTMTRGSSTGTDPPASGSTPSDVVTPMTVRTDAVVASPGDLFYTDMATPSRLLWTDPHGQVRWTARGAASYADFRLQNYQNRPVLTWWESPSTGLAAYADGRAVITGLDHAEVDTVEKSGNVAPDEHEFLLTSRGTALIVSYVRTTVDLRPYGGVRAGLVMNGIAEEIDLTSGTVLLHWESLDHVSLAESHAGLPADPSEPWDYFHINSVKPTPDDQLLISARHTWAVYKIDRDTGRVRWRLGGKKSDFVLPSAGRFGWQHDAVVQRPGLLRMFDNGSDGDVVVNKVSSVLWLQLDERRRRASVYAKFTHPDRLSAAAMGNAQLLPNGHVFVGWGTAKRLSEFDTEGRVVFDATLPNVCYRGYRLVVD
ncbi:MAG: arylsulfotransferase family protein [Propionibacteriaceae bacterium]